GEANYPVDPLGPALLDRERGGPAGRGREVRVDVGVAQCPPTGEGQVLGEGGDDRGGGTRVLVRHVERARVGEAQVGDPAAGEPDEAVVPNEAAGRPELG